MAEKAKGNRKFGRYVTMMTDAGAKMRERMNGDIEASDRKKVARIARLLALAALLVGVIYLVNFIRIIL